MSADRAALLATRAALSAAMAVIDERLAAPEADPLVPVKVAARRWNVSERTALRRIRGLGEFVAGRWFVRRSVMERMVV